MVVGKQLIAEHIKRKSDFALLSKITYLRSKRAGSLFPMEFEAGWIYGMLYSLGLEPQFKMRKDVVEWIKSVPK